MAIKKTKVEEHENHERWLVSYADFITLLFAFFVVLYATSNSDLKKQKEFEKSVRTNLKLAESGSGSGDKSSAESASVSQSPEEVNLKRVLLELNHPITGPEETELDGPSLEKKSNNQILKANLQKMLGSESDRQEKGIEIRHDTLGVRISLRAAAFFASGSAKLKPSAIKTLSDLGEVIKKTDRNLLVEGHTDNQPVDSAIFPSNWELASNRATTVVRFLAKTQGIDPHRLAAISYADQKPLVPNDTEEGRSKNRRIEILLLNDKIL